MNGLIRIGLALGAVASFGVVGSGCEKSDALKTKEACLKKHPRNSVHLVDDICAYISSDCAPFIAVSPTLTKLCMDSRRMCKYVQTRKDNSSEDCGILEDPRGVLSEICDPIDRTCVAIPQGEDVVSLHDLCMHVSESCHDARVKIRSEGRPLLKED